MAAESFGGVALQWIRARKQAMHWPLQIVELGTSFRFCIVAFLHPSSLPKAMGLKSALVSGVQNLLQSQLLAIQQAPVEQFDSGT